MRKLALALLAACSGSNHHDVMVQPDAPPDAPPATNAIALQVFGATPAYIAYRDGAGPWQTPPAPDSSGTYTLMVANDYQVVVACHDTTGSSANLLAATSADNPKQYVFCDRGTTTIPTTVAVTGQMAQAGTVFMTDQATGSTAPWSFSLNVTPGPHELIAMSTNHKMLIRRGLDIGTATTVQPVDVAADGTAMPPLALTLGGLAAGDSVFTGFDLFLTDDFAMWDSQTATIDAPPAALMTSSDFSFLFAEAYSATSARYADATYTGTQTSFTLPAPLTGITFGKVTATWTALPTYDDATLTLDQTRGQLQVSQNVRATKHWVDTTHATSLTFDAMPPGFDTSWNVDASTAYSQSLAIAYDAGGVTYGSSLFDASSAAAQRTLKRPWFSTVARLRESIRSQHTMPCR